jgi:hypothetical protein
MCARRAPPIRSPWYSFYKGSHGLTIECHIASARTFDLQRHVQSPISIRKDYAWKTDEAAASSTRGWHNVRNDLRAIWLDGPTYSPILFWPAEQSCS